MQEAKHYSSEGVILAFWTIEIARTRGLLRDPTTPYLHTALSLGLWLVLWDLMPRMQTVFVSGQPY